MEKRKGTRRAGQAAEARILWDKPGAAVEQIEQTGDQDSSLASLLAWVSRAE
jgi:hypothetical protein